MAGGEVPSCEKVAATSTLTGRAGALSSCSVGWEAWSEDSLLDEPTEVGLDVLRQRPTFDKHTEFHVQGHRIGVQILFSETAGRPACRYARRPTARHGSTGPG